MDKYELIPESGTDMYRIRALRGFADVEAGDSGGFVESASNLSHLGNAWVSGSAQVYGDCLLYTSPSPRDA